MARPLHFANVMMKRLSLILLAAAACTDDTSQNETPNEPTATFKLRIDNIVPFEVLKSGTIGTGPIAPGQRFEIRFTAGKGHAVSFATMLGESNDWFFAPGPDGIRVFDDAGKPMSGNVTKYVKLWNAGTEIDQEPAIGDATAPRQPMPNYGAPDPDKRVREVPGIVVSKLVEVTLVHHGEREFSLVILNCSTNRLVTSQGPISIHLSPLVWALHRMPAPLFTPGEPDRGRGLERIAEDGNPAELGGALAKVTGFHTPLSPGVVVVHQGAAPLFAVGSPDYGAGLERIAEDGNPAELADQASAVFDTPIGASAPGPAMPGMRYETSVVAAPGDRLTLVTMYGMSNDWLFAVDGVPLFDGTTPRAGELPVALYDLGSEHDQEIDIGPGTAPQQPAPNTGAADPNNAVRPAAHNVPATTHLRVTLTPQ
ncbi:MAG: spondin domain-containing protein [Myxococcota bacterium]|nr:spondin domain-containing protein [Myxococcota bacterium]